jgi:predicted ATPase
MRTIQSVRLDSFLSFEPGSEAFPLESLNVLIGPNGSGKSNVIEAFELLRATSADFAGAVRDGGGASEWLWKGKGNQSPSTLDVELGAGTPTKRPLRYRLEFTSVQSRVEVLDEAIEEVEPVRGKDDVLFYYRFRRGRPVINSRGARGIGGRWQRHLERETFLPDQSVLAQRKDPDLYPEVTWVGQRFALIQTFREWTFGRYAALRQPQPADLPEDRLLPVGLSR